VAALWIGGDLLGLSWPGDGDAHTTLYGRGDKWRLGRRDRLFIGGGLAMVRHSWAKVTWLAWFFPNTYAVDPVRDMVLFQAWPADWTPTLLTLIGFALVSLIGGMALTARQLRRLG
jgi:hypothetical protein